MSIHRKWECSFYEDEGGNVRINEVDLGDIWENTVAEKVFYIKNDSEYIVKDVTVESVNTEVKVVKHPKRVIPNIVYPIEVQWTPNVLSLSLHDELNINGVMVIR